MLLPKLFSLLNEAQPKPYSHGEHLQQNFAGDLSRMLNTESYYNEDVFLHSPIKEGCGVTKSIHHAIRESPNSMFIERFECPRRKNRLLLFSDSFGVALDRILATEFAEVTSVRAHPNFFEFNYLLEQEQPDLVAEIFVERMFAHKPERGRPVRQNFRASFK